MLGGWGGIHVGCVTMVLGLTQFCVQHVGNGVIRGVWVWDAWCSGLGCSSSVSLPVPGLCLGQCWGVGVGGGEAVLQLGLVLVR